MWLVCRGGALAKARTATGACTVTPTCRGTKFRWACIVNDVWRSSGSLQRWIWHKGEAWNPTLRPRKG